MKKIALFIALFSVLAPTALANQEKSVDCSSPTQLAGASAKVKGALKLTALPNGQMAASGNLNIRLSEGRQIVVQQNLVKVKGVYDNIDNTEYAVLGATNNKKIDTIYLNFSAHDSSYIELANGKKFLLNCTANN
jgi:hypothetical protein